MMGCGKSSVGKNLAEKMGYHFLDTDQLIEEKEQMPIDIIFKEQGELYFRGIEKKILNDLEVNKTIIATGGGMVEMEGSFHLFQKLGISVYLKCSLMNLMERVADDTKVRPNSKNENQFKDLLHKRTPLYEKADLVVDCDGFSVLQIAEQISDQFRI